ncbi:N(G),N(G)-dimethylarginine dimethylaminohydrolase 1 [Branchiostoma belcheri]|nr:N(G),N(G)-dimethylarginine dimethylaminohydrolase 1 [Branchiostoma belcheri]
MADRTYGGFTTAIVREIPGSLAGDAAPPAEGEEREDAVQAVDLQKARDEWTTYVDTLRTLGLRVITIPADEECPGCAFVADTAVVVDGIAFITRPTNPDRRKEPASEAGAAGGGGPEAGAAGGGGSGDATGSTVSEDPAAAADVDDAPLEEGKGSDKKQKFTQDEFVLQQPSLAMDLIVRSRALKAVKEVLEAQLGVGNVAELRDIEATLDGRDVLFTGREFFVRVTESNNNAPQSPTRRTTRKKEKPAPKNDAGARLLARVFPDFQVTSLYIQGDRPLQSYLSMAGPVHTLIVTSLYIQGDRPLQSYLSMAGPDIIAAGEGEDAQRVIEQIIEKAEYKYKVLCLPEDSAVDCVFVNGSLVHRTQEEIPKSTEVIEAKLTDLKKVIVPNSELAKVGATLSALTVFI